MAHFFLDSGAITRALSISYWSVNPLISSGFKGPYVASSSTAQAKQSNLILMLLTKGYGFNHTLNNSRHDIGNGGGALDLDKELVVIGFLIVEKDHGKLFWEWRAF